MWKSIFVVIGAGIEESFSFVKPECGLYVVKVIC